MFLFLYDVGNEVVYVYGFCFCLFDDFEVFYCKFGFDFLIFNGDDSWMLLMPARYVIDAEGVVRWSAVHPDYTRRPEPDDTIEALRALE